MNSFIQTFYDEGDGGSGTPPEPPAPPAGLLPPGDGDPPQPPSGDPPQPPAEYKPFSIYEDGKVSQGFVDWVGDDKGLLKMAEKYAGAEDPAKAFAKGIGNLQYLAGQKGLDVLPEDAPDDVKAERHQLLGKLNGVPEKPDGYGIKAPDDLKDVWKDETITAFSQVLHKHNASPELAKDLMELEAKMEREAIQDSQASIDQTKSEEIESLKNEHGANFSKVIQAAKDGARTLGLSDEEANQIATSAVAVNALAKINTMVAEDQIITSDGTPAGGGSYREQSRRIAQDPNHPLYAAYHDPNNPNYEHALSEKKRLSKLASEKEGRSGLA